MAILLEDSLTTSLKRWYPQTSDYSSRTTYPKIFPINNVIKGSLTTLTDTYDPYELNVQTPTFVRIKFNVEQITNSNDYYILDTPLGIFYMRDSHNKERLINGIDFIVESSAVFNVRGGGFSLLSENYTLEINEMIPGYWINPISPTLSVSQKPIEASIGANNTVNGWNNSKLKLTTPPLNKGETGTIVVYLDSFTNYVDPSNKDAHFTNFLPVRIQNEANRYLGFTEKIKEKNFYALPDLQAGIYYINIESDYFTTTQYNLQINFYKTFNSKETIVYNTSGLDRFPDWDNKLDKIIYSESINNYTIGETNSLGHFNVSHKVKTDDFDVLQAVERVVFLDKTIAFDFSSSEAGYKSAMLIAASFGKEYIPQFFAKGLSFFDSGSTTKEIAKLIADNKFIEQLIGDNSDSAWIKHVYKNVVGVYPDKASETNYVTLLQNKTSTRSEILELAAGFTFLETRIDLVGLQTNGLVFDTLS
jgi:hypothetical protein